MIRHELPSGQTLYCDDQDQAALESHRWWASYSGQNVYAVTELNKKTISFHRLITGAVKGQYVDHIDGNGLNNCRSNLRICTQSQNLGNQRKRGLTSPFKGVCRYPSKSNPWQAKITRDGKLIHLGVFSNPEDAARAYDNAARAYHGEFARVNFPIEGERGVA